jgi:hypothetical protein
MTVVSSFRAEDIDLGRSSAEGVRLLRAFLDYAARGGDAEDLESAASEATPLHEEIAAVLTTAGVETQLMLGASSDRIDVVAVDPASSLPRVAIEIDGVAYAGRPSVRDRDRLRPEQLERLGWSHVSTWTQDWYRDPAGAAGRLTDEVVLALDSENGNGADGLLEVELDVTTAVAEDPTVVDRGPRPTFPSGRTAITDWPHADLVRLGHWIESDGHLRTAEDLKSALMQELGIKRRGSRVARILDEVVADIRQ